MRWNVSSIWGEGGGVCGGLPVRTRCYANTGTSTEVPHRYRATKQRMGYRVINVDWEREGSTANVHIPLAGLGPNVKAVLWLQTLATVKPPQRGFKSQTCAWHLSMAALCFCVPSWQLPPPPPPPPPPKTEEAKSEVMGWRWVQAWICPSFCFCAKSFSGPQSFVVWKKKS